MFQNNEYKQNKRPRFANFKNINLESARMSWRGQASLAQKFLRSEESFVRGGSVLFGRLRHSQSLQKWFVMQTTSFFAKLWRIYRYKYKRTTYLH